MAMCESFGLLVAAGCGGLTGWQAEMAVSTEASADDRAP
jgi:hypothetical protein